MRLTPLAAVAIGCALLAPIGHADNEKHVVKVKVADLVLTLADDQVRLAERFSSAGEAICGLKPSGISIPETQHYTACKSSLALDAADAKSKIISAAFARGLGWMN